MNVLIVEDDFRVANIHEQFLKDIPEVKVKGKAATVMEALTLLEGNKVDLLLLDVYMPDQLGTDMLHLIRKKYSALGIIIITATSEKELVEKAFQYGIDDYIIKPITFDRFKQAIDKFKKRKKLLEGKKIIEQDIIDQYFRSEPLKSSKDTVLPKGIDPITLEKVKQILKGRQAGITAEEMGMEMGASRTTARRYLEYMTSIAKVKAEVEYGIVGRPERQYRLNDDMY
ncbi:response regulator [Halalkalibacterium ligniniphilum]|uniref:response regulator n=1 Tax=Halalkalibacterium ligniniphilum TaxID=1134413 RepID=UPI00034B0DDD|nr:response regulator [Halalkalibacterium ligniniphilum]